MERAGVAYWWIVLVKHVNGVCWWSVTGNSSVRTCTVQYSLTSVSICQHVFAVLAHT